MKALDVVKVGRRDDWLGYGERARAAFPERVYLTIRKGPKPEEAFGRHWCFKASGLSEGDRRASRQPSHPARGAAAYRAIHQTRERGIIFTSLSPSAAVSAWLFSR
jgi:hypothetical protein